jgi:hypothetical protein
MQVELSIQELGAEMASELPERALLRRRHKSQRQSFHQSAHNSNHTVISQSGIANSATVNTTQVNVLLGFQSAAQG